MVAAKILYALLIILVVLAVYLFFSFKLDRAFYQVTDQGVQGLLDAGKCSLGILDPDCSRKETEGACLSDLNCVWCVGEINQQKVSTCRLAVCGCGSFYSESGVDISTSKLIYAPGEILSISGMVTTITITDKSNLNIQISFLDKDKKETNLLGTGETVVTKDSEGNFDWTYQIPADAKIGRYYVLAEFGKARALEEFYVEV